MSTANPENGKMSFWSHLDELRKRIVYISIAIGVGFIACFQYSEDILGVLLLPLNATAGFQGSFPFITFTPNKYVQELHFTALTEPFMAHLKIGFVAGMMLMLPVILYQIWKFISPGLLRHERKYASQFVVFATIFFGIGVLFCFFFLLAKSSPF